MHAQINDALVYCHITAKAQDKIHHGQISKCASLQSGKKDKILKNRDQKIKCWYVVHCMGAHVVHETKSIVW